MKDSERKLFGKYHYAFLILIGCCFLQAFGLGLVMNCSSLFYTPVCSDLGFPRADFSTYMTFYFIATIVVTPLAGKLLSSYDTRIVMSTAIIILAIGVALMGTYTQVWQFQISGFIIGAAGSCIFVLPAAMLVGNWFIKRKGVVYGFAMSFSGIGAAVFAQLINYIIQVDGWRAAYVVTGILALVFILPWTLFVFRAKPSDLNLAPYGYVPSEGEDKLPIMQGVSLKRALRSLSFVALFVFAGFTAFCHSGVDAHLPSYIQTIGYTAGFGATIVSALSIGSVVDKMLMGWLNDVIGVQRTTFIQIAVIILGVLGFIFINNPIVLIISAVCFGTQDSLMTVSVPLLIRQIFGSKNYTQIHAWIRVGIGIFGASAAMIVGGIYDQTGSFLSGFYLAAILYAACAVLIGLAYVGRKKLVWD